MNKRLYDLKVKADKHKVLIHNFGYLSALRVFTMLVPLITIPYLLKVLGKETYGLIVFAQTIVSYFLVLINFGFNLSATKDISIHRENKEKLSEIVSSILIVKGIFFFVSLVVLWFILNLTPKAYEYKSLFYLMMYLCLYEWIFPIWYFQGTEKMKYITYINLVSRSFFLVLIFFLVKSEDDYLKVPIINGIGFTVAGVIALWVVFFRDGIIFKFQSRKTLKKHTHASLPIFLGNIAGQIKMLGNKTILGAFVGMESVAIYDIADKIKGVFLTFFELIPQVLFPNVSKTKNHNLVRNSIKILLCAGLLSYVLSGAGLHFITAKYFTGYREAANIFWILGLLIFIQSVSYLIKNSVLFVNGLKREYVANLYISTFSYLTFILIFWLFKHVNIYTVSFSLVLSVVVELISNVLACRHNKLLHWLTLRSR